MAGSADIARAEIDALRWLRSRRLQRRLGQVDIIDALYRAYLVVLFGAIVIYVASRAAGGAPVAPDVLRTAMQRGPGFVGAGFGVLLSIAMVAGARGGPLAFEPADIHLVLLAPVDRRAALRPLAFRVIGSAAWIGVALGVEAGFLASHRFPGSKPAWLLAPAATGAVAGGLLVAAALIANGARLRPPNAQAIAMTIAVWSLLDARLRTTTAPTTLLARIAMQPLHPHGAPLAVAASTVMLMTIVALAIADRVVPRIAVEAAERRSSLVAQVRFAATVRDVRTVIVLRRQLANRDARSKPWIPLPTSRRRPKMPALRRAWHGVLRWPASRVARTVVFAAAAGAATAAAEHGSRSFIALAAVLLWVVALDATEAIAQDVDHPTRLDALAATSPLVRQFAAAFSIVAIPAAAMGASFAAVNMRFDGSLATSAIVEFTIAAALSAIAGATITVVMGPPTPPELLGMIIPEAAATTIIIQSAGPIAVAGVGTYFTLAAHAHALPAIAVAVVIVVLVMCWLSMAHEP